MPADQFRLDAADMTAVRDAMAKVTHTWMSARHKSPNKPAPTVAQLRTAGARALGCTVLDLRDTEIDWLEDEAGYALTVVGAR